MPKENQMQKWHFENARWLLLSFFVVIFDQFSKLWVLHSLVLGQPKVLLPFLNFSLNYNSGAAFSMLASAGGWQRWLFSSLSIAIAILLFIWLLELQKNQKVLLTAIALIIGGALSNLIDRVVRGFVIDFVDFHIGTWHFAVFNLADSAISIGTFILILCLLFGKTQK